jgi:hypothetical protein
VRPRASLVAPATSSSPACPACAAPTKVSPGTPWSAARRIPAAQPGVVHGTARPTQRPPATPAFPARDRTYLGTGREAASTVPQGATCGAIVSRHRTTQSLLNRSITGINQASSYSDRRPPTGRASFASKGSASEFLSTASIRLKLGSGFADRRHISAELRICGWRLNSPRIRQNSVS